MAIYNYNFYTQKHHSHRGQTIHHVLDYISVLWSLAQCVATQMDLPEIKKKFSIKSEMYFDDTGIVI